MVEKIHSIFNVVIGMCLAIAVGVSHPGMGPISSFIIGACAGLLIFREVWLYSVRLSWSISNLN